MSDSSKSTSSCVFPRSQLIKKPVTREKTREGLLKLRAGDSLRHYSFILRNKSEKQQTKNKKRKGMEGGRAGGWKKNAAPQSWDVKCKCSCHSREGPCRAGASSEPEALEIEATKISTESPQGQWQI